MTTTMVSWATWMLLVAMLSRAALESAAAAALLLLAVHLVLCPLALRPLVLLLHLDNVHVLWPVSQTGFTY